MHFNILQRTGEEQEEAKEQSPADLSIMITIKSGTKLAREEARKRERERERETVASYSAASVWAAR